ncbi:MAG: V4R domain-containing protein [Paenibacillus macerans]|uniref:4-vinyl reductase n=1 Tax=Paenibacillus macerans TaxID=44252 RepID=A0A090Y956_PAEMA|nr:V4R domain-containing protein [Paenibacillus macerans]KFM94711.1 V4R domain protein [Paenibacillus macerans]MBS5912563.1 4-vinyl reductase [Paenibacillus macerans]MCY7558641.1 4-vinyl reductase [Paenibacillus macerans]MDU5945863.1 V4R domain-containing protein [Paenibacillus macerans]MDU7475467.1 V4R domain-containing protein [Paenibacillus macerans]
MTSFTFEDLQRINRVRLGDEVPLELFRAIRLIGMQQGLPLEGKGTTASIGRKIGESLPVGTLEELLELFAKLRIGLPRVLQRDERLIRIAVDDCFCKGLPVIEEKKVCDLEGAILEGALGRILNRKVSVRETQCNVSGDEHCEYEIRIYG